jgi:hypothetical protein
MPSTIGSVESCESEWLTGSVQWDNMISNLHVVHAFSDALHDTSTLMSEDDGESSLWVFTRKSVVIAVSSAFVSWSQTLNLRVTDTGADCQL